MGLVIYEPFEFWPLVSGAGWSFNDDAIAMLALPTGISGMDGRCLACNAGGCTDVTVYWDLPSPLSTVYMTFLYRPVNSYTYGNEIVTFRNSSGTILGMLGRGSDGKLNAYRGWGAGWLGGSTTSLSNNVTYRVDVEYTPHDTAGVFKVWITTPDQPPVLEIDITGTDTTDGSGSVSRLLFGEQGGHTDIAIEGYIDCLAVADDAIPGIIKAKILLPNAAGYIAQMSQFPNSGDPYEKVNDQGRQGPEINYAECIYGASVGLIHAFDLTTLNTTGIDQIVAVKPLVLGKLDWAGVPTKIQAGIRSNGANFFSDEQMVPIGWYPDGGHWETRPVSKLFLTDPYDSSPWSNSKADSLEVVMKVS